MREIFTYSSIIKKHLLVERSLIKALRRIDLIDDNCFSRLEKCFENIDPNDLALKTIEYEERIGHEITAMTRVLEDLCGECGRFIHYGATSNDIIDTSWALTIREALEIIKKRLREVIEILMDLSIKHRDTLMIGRTHGQHALPITLGFKLSNYVYELSRSYERICESEKRVVRGKFSGAVGTMASWGDKGLEIETLVLENLGLEPHVISTQVAPRDGFAEISLMLAVLASQLDRFALEIRELSRPEINEVYSVIERVGSSTMPHKRNPVIAERISGLARAARSLATSFLENIVLMHERDLSNSSFERYALPHMFLIIDQMLIDTRKILEEIRFDEEAMRKNLELSKGAVLSERILLELIRKGVSRRRAHEVLSKLSRESIEKNIDFKEILRNNAFIRAYLSEEDIERLVDYAYLGSYDKLINRSIEYAKEILIKC